MSKRTIQTGTSTITIIENINEQLDLRRWLETQAGAHGLITLLAHCEDGALWGVMEGGRLLLSAEALEAKRSAEALEAERSTGPRERSGPRLRWATLVQARLFGPDAELLLWRGPTRWQARLRDDRVGVETRCIDEEQLLWGTGTTDARRIATPFMELVEGRQGIRHAPPVAGVLPANARAALHVRHYLAEDVASGAALVVDSRLVNVVSTEVQQ